MIQGRLFLGALKKLAQDQREAEKRPGESAQHRGPPVTFRFCGPRKNDNNHRRPSTGRSDLSWMVSAPWVREYGGGSKMKTERTPDDWTIHRLQFDADDLDEADSGWLGDDESVEVEAELEADAKKAEEEMTAALVQGVMHGVE